MRVLVACEFSGVVRDAFKANGHDAWSCDLLPTEAPGNHIQDDVLKHLNDGWDLMIAHPPCTYLSYVGMRHWHAPGRSEKRNAALDFFMSFILCNIPKIAVENPLGYPSQAFRAPDQIIHPYYFGEPIQKRTCLWLKNLPPLQYSFETDWFYSRTATDKPDPIYICQGVKSKGKKIHWTEAMRGCGKDRGHARSKSFPSIAKAMADQWGGISSLTRDIQKSGWTSHRDTGVSGD